MARRAFVLILLLLCTFAAAQRPTVVPARKRAVVIGVEEFKDLAPLTYAAEDADLFAETLQKELKFEASEIKVLKTGGAVPPTQANVLKAINETLADPALQSGELFVLYFSGHGVGQPEGDFLVPSDATEATISNSGIRVNDVLSRITAKGLRNVMLVADACRSGKENRFGNELLVQARKANIALLLGCAPGSRSYEYPRLGHGVFTHFLAKAMAERTTLDANGALWTSQIAARVGQNVREYTEADYGEDAQRPGGWADPARDVMLRVEPSTFSADQVTTFAANPKSLTPEMYAASMTTLARSLYHEHRYTECIRILKTIDAVGGADGTGLFTLASALLLSGREGEADAMFRRLEADPNPYISHFAKAMNPSKLIPGDVRLKAAEALWEITPDEFTGQMLWGISRLVNSASDHLRILLTLQAKLPQGTRFQAFLTGDAALIENNLTRAADEFERGLNLPPGNSVNADATIFLLGTVLSNLGDEARFKRVVRTFLVRDTKDAAPWVYAAYLLKSRGKHDEALAIAVEASKRENLDGDLMQLTMTAAGIGARHLAPGFEANAKRYPADWKVQMYAILASSVANGGGFDMEEFQRRGRVQAGDDLTVYSLLCPAVEGMVSDGVERGLIPPEKLTSVLVLFAAGLKEEIDGFNRSGDLWRMLTYYCMYGEDSGSITKLFRLHIGAAEPGDDPTLRQTRLLIAMANGDDAGMREAWKSGGLLEPDRSDVGWHYAMIRWVRGGADEAQEIVATLRPASLDDRYGAALRLVLENDPAKLAAYKPKDETDSQLLGIALARLGDWKRAEPLLKTALLKRRWATLPVPAEALRLLADHYREAGDQEALVDTVGNVVYAHVGNPLFSKLSALLKPDLAGYAMSYSGLTALASPNEEPIRGTVDATVKPDGTFEAVFHPDSGEDVKIRGVFDIHGNLTGSTTISGQPYDLAAKLVPPRLWREGTSLREIGQVLFLTGPKGKLQLLGLRPLPSQGNLRPPISVNL